MKKLNGACVPLVHLSSYKDWQTVKVKDGKKEIERSKEVPRLTVDELQNITYEAPKPLTDLGRWATPTCLIISGDEKKLGALTNRGSMKADEILKEIAKAQKTLGKQTPEKSWKPFLKAARAVTDALRAEELEKAVKALDGLEKIKNPTDLMKKESEAITRKVMDAGEHHLEMAGYLYDADEDEGKKVLQKLLKMFKGYPLEKKIQAKLDGE